MQTGSTERRAEHPDGDGRKRPQAGSDEAAHTPQDVLLDVSGVCVAFGGLQALDDVSFQVSPGEVLGLIGPNGAGKTTVFNVICGFVRPDRGAIGWSGQPLRRIHTDRLSRLGIARTVQSLGLFSNLSSLHNVMVGATRHSRAGFFSGLFALPRSDKDERALRERSYAVLEQLGVADIANRLPGTLPYGTQKRVALARALVSEPRLLLLDEPASGLSEGEMSELGDLIGQLRGQMSVLLVEHHMDLVMSVCERIVVLDFGKVIATGSPSEVQNDPAVLDAYLGQAVHTDEPVEHPTAATYTTSAATDAAGDDDEGGDPA